MRPNVTLSTTRACPAVVSGLYDRLQHCSGGDSSCIIPGTPHHCRLHQAADLGPVAAAAHSRPAVSTANTGQSLPDNVATIGLA